MGLSGDYGPADVRSADMVHSEDRGGGKKDLKGRGSGTPTSLSVTLLGEQ